MPVLNYVYAIYGSFFILACMHILVNDYLKKTFTYLHIVLLIIQISSVDYANINVIIQISNLKLAKECILLNAFLQLHKNVIQC